MIMNKMLLLCVEDEAEVRDAMVRDLAGFESAVRLEAAEDVADAREVLAQCIGKGHPLALVLCDHLLPGTKGVDYLVELNQDGSTKAARKVLITGQAGLEDTIKAVNDAGLDHYISKPWTPKQLQDVVRKQLTDFAIEAVEDLLPLLSVLEGDRLLEEFRDRKQQE